MAGPAGEVRRNLDLDANPAAAGALAGVAVLLWASGESLVTSANSGLPLRRRLARYALAAVLAPVLTLVLAGLRGPQALAAVPDRAREASGMESVTLLERGHSAGSATWGRAAGWTPVAERQPGTRRGLRDPMPARCRHGSARPDGQSRGVTWYGLRRLGREIRHGHVA